MKDHAIHFMMDDEDRQKLTELSVFYKEKMACILRRLVREEHRRVLNNQKNPGIIEDYSEFLKRTTGGLS